ncbi:uncharacterized protein EDB91DRAFT_1048951 [Suillus paluster]|uniref:uncharacterized protein n=1 Tax=Suillus paluster TaxID=48578 RepID=UPI001B878406|nr:uncharacterized protein EDB91DRAFT_1048951 [Suillus paluster]KAG1746657.1 hypothetical protein EDB91DRAFT_1048951 [Suillus paluster]
MQSDSSSSVKRSASEGPSSATPVAVPMTDTSPAREQDIDIDAYMAEQGEDVPFQPTQPCPVTIEHKVARIRQLRDQPMVAGDTWYIISRQWFRRWEIACGILSDKAVEPLQEKDIGPPDNTSLFDSQGNLTSNLVEHIDVEFLPQEAWSEFVTWYGQPISPLPRSVIAKAFLQTALELRPPRLKVLVLKDLGPDADIAGPPHSYATVSIKDSMKSLTKALVSAVTARSNVPYRIWKLEPGDLSGSQFPASRLVSCGAELVGEETDKTVEDKMIEPEDPFVVEFQENGTWIVDASQVVRPPPPSVHGPPPLFSENDFFSRMTNQQTSLPNTQSFRTPSPSRRSSSSKAKETTVAPFKSFGFTKGSSKTIQVPGTLGLGNMGNTCFMNSALQCLAHTKELTDYFLSGVYQEELNPDNPLGMHGAIAEAFGTLLHRIWARDSAASSYSPREFKSQLQKFAPQFSGYQQHDSQELVAFLLDGLHEDLNRVLKKPYIEKPDWEGGQDFELAKLAQTSWEGYMKRNDSVIVDLFQGQYQSTLVCPECQKVSFTFDPFMYLTLPLPVNKKWEHVIYYVPWDPSVPHRKVPVQIGRDSSFKDLKNLLGRWMGSKPKWLLTLEVFNHRFYKNLDDSVLCGEMADSDRIFCFELPCNSRQSRSYKPKDDDPYIIPVILTDVLPPRPAYANYSRGTNNFGCPFIAVIFKDDARSVEGMYDAVIERLRRWTVHEKDLYTWQTGPSVDDTVTIPISTVSPVDSFTEIKENGDVNEVDGMVIEGDIADQKILVDEDAGMESDTDDGLYLIGPKQGVFNLHLYTGYKDYSAGGYGSSNGRPEHWDSRIEELEPGAPLLKEGDAFICEFDENIKAYYFGTSQVENSRWEEWFAFMHPEFVAAKEAALVKKTKGITLDDCLAEFTKQEQLGEDDLWYCPRCKKHQQATKKFDLWKVPDILAVHLKRFSNSRALRDKIDTFVDFPIEGLDLTALVGERRVGTSLAQSGVNIQELGIREVEEPLIYDLYAVDEHLGGLGGGHYRAYALNHVTEQWYHFDDSYVSRTDASHAVNSNAYLLFYKRRSSAPLGGKTHEKIEEARRKATAEVEVEAESVAVQEVHLPTPPSETGAAPFPFPLTQQPSSSGGYMTPRSNPRSSPTSSPPPLDDGDPSTSEAQNDDSIADDGLGLGPLELANQQFDFPDPSARASPTSSVEVEPDYDDEPPRSSLFRAHANIDSWVGSSSLPSPVGSDSEMNPFSDMNSQKKRDADSMDL